MHVETLTREGVVMPRTPSTPSSSSTSAIPTATPAVRTVALGVVAALVLFITGAVFSGVASAEVAPDKVFVCKYVGTPGEDERLANGQNPISVSVNAVESPEVGSVFNDQQGRSYVIAVDDGDTPAPECPDTPPGNGTETTPPMTETTPPSTSTTTPDTPGAAPTDLGPIQTTGILSLFAIAAGLLFVAARLLRGARH